MALVAGRNAHDGLAAALHDVLRAVDADLRLSHPDELAHADRLTGRPGWRPWWDHRPGMRSTVGRRLDTLDNPEGDV